jgi:hypothetical protein
MKNLILLLLLFPLTIIAQENIAINVAQDLRMATTGDSNGNKAFTTNIMARVDLQSNQLSTGYLVVGVQYEYADLEGSSFNRYSLNAGYTFNKFNLFGSDKLEFTLLGSYGGTVRTVFRHDRYIRPIFASFSGSMSLSYPIGDTGFRVIAIGQLLHRVDKTSLYGDDASYTLPLLNADASGFVGIQYTIKLDPIRRF